MDRRLGEPKKGSPTMENSKKAPALENGGGDDEEGAVSGVVGSGGGSKPGGGGGVGEEEKRRRLSSPPCGGGGSSSSVSVVARRGGSGGGGGGGSQPCCQAEKCAADLTDAKRYHRRHKVCEAHSKAAVVVVAGIRQRFCQQCSRFHELSEFDEAKRSCRRRLAGHNERRRKSSSESQGEDSNRCRQADQSGRAQITLPGTTAYKHFQIR